MSRLHVSHVPAMHYAMLRVVHYFNFSIDTQEQVALANYLCGLLLQFEKFWAVEVEIDIEVIVDDEVGANRIAHNGLGEILDAKVGDGLLGKLLIHGGGRVRGVRVTFVVLCKDKKDLQKEQIFSPFLFKKRGFGAKKTKKEENGYGLFGVFIV